MPSPFNRERRKLIQDDCKELLRKFTSQYVKNFGMAIFLKAVENNKISESEHSSTKLTFRNWNAVERDLFHGPVNMRSGPGPSDLKDWSPAYMAERTDYTIAIYASKTNYSEKKAPKLVIEPTGYHLERSPTIFYKNFYKALAEGMSISEEKFDNMVSFSPFSWALTHPWRKNFLFQLHPGAKSRWGLSKTKNIAGVLPYDSGSELAEQREEYLEVFARCQANHSVRDKNSVHGMTFEMTLHNLGEDISDIFNWQHNGTESQVLCDILMVQCMLPIRDEMLADIEGPSKMRLTNWYKIQKQVYNVVRDEVNIAWADIQERAIKISDSVRDKLDEGLIPIVKTKKIAQDRIRAQTDDEFNHRIQVVVKPFIDSIYKAFNDPLTKAFACARQLLEEKIEISELQAHAEKMREQLDSVPRTRSNIKYIIKACDELVDSLQGLKQAEQDVFTSMDIWLLRSQAEMVVLRLFDAAVFTFGNIIEKDGLWDEDTKRRILHDFDHDVYVVRCAFIKTVTCKLLLPIYKKCTYSVTQPLINTMDDIIPEEFVDILNLPTLIDSILEDSLQEHISNLVEIIASRTLPEVRPL